MDFQKKNVKNMCSFYASDVHLSMMLLPYLSKQMENGVIFETLLNEDLTESVKGLISKLNLKDEVKNKMLNINWNTTLINNEEQVDSFMKSLLKNKNTVSIILNGNNDEVQITNDFLNKWINTNKHLTQNKQITLISCFKAIEFKDKINDVIDKYDCSLNTSGEHDIKELFNIYKNVINL